MRPRLTLTIELEELPRTAISADSAEDEARLRSWIEHETVRRRLLDCLEDALEELGRAA